MTCDQASTAVAGATVASSSVDTSCRETGGKEDEAMQANVAYARKKVERAKNFMTMPGKTK